MDKQIFYLVKQEDDETGIVRYPKIKVEEFIDIVKKLIVFSEKCLKIKEQLDAIN
jgi:hypothetical protein